MKLMALIALALALAFDGEARAANVGFQELTIANGADRSLKVGVWYPTVAPASEHRLETFTQTVAPDGPVAGTRLPLVVISHGMGGSYAGHYDTALALARAGFVAASVSHTGDTWDDHSRQTMIWGRAEHIKRLIDYMTGEWSDHRRIDARRIGVFGFSAGGFTALVDSGGVADLTKIAPYCQTHPDTFTCGIVRSTPGTLERVADVPASAWISDRRIRTAVVAAPALGFAFGKPGLKEVRIPVQLWRAEFDHILPSPDYADAVLADLPRRPDFRLVKNADHYDFLAPCSEKLAKEVPDICTSRAGFDRAAFHADFNRQLVAFFRRTLR